MAVFSFRYCLKEYFFFHINVLPSHNSREKSNFIRYCVCLTNLVKAYLKIILPADRQVHADHYFVFRKEHLLKNYALGIDIGGTSIKGAVFSIDGRVAFLTAMPTEAEKAGKKVLDNVLFLIRGAY